MNLRHALLLCMLTVCALNPARAATLTFYNGVILNIGTDSGCGIGPGGNIEEQAESGFSLLGGNYTPAIGEIWYAHVVISHPGCDAGNANGIEILLPPSTTFAIDAGNPVYCAIRNHDNSVNVYYRQNQGCPQAPSQGVQGYAFPAYNGSQAVPWIIASGTYLELMIPLRSSAVLTASTMSFRVNPDVGLVSYPAVGVYVNGDVVFRSEMEDNNLLPDVCTIPGTTTCTLVQ